MQGQKALETPKKSDKRKSMPKLSPIAPPPPQPEAAQYSRIQQNEQSEATEQLLNSQRLGIDKRKGSASQHPFLKSQSDTHEFTTSAAFKITDNIFDSQPQRLPIDEINLEDEEDRDEQLFKYTFEEEPYPGEVVTNIEEDDHRTATTVSPMARRGKQNNYDEDEKEIEALDYQDQYYQKTKKEDMNCENQDEGDECQQRSDFDQEEDEVRGESPDITIEKVEKCVIEDSKSVGAGESKQQEKKATTQVIVREVRYTAYSENMEQTLKMLSCQKNISLIDKKDPKYKRMFITAQHTKTINLQPQHQAVNESQLTVLTQAPVLTSQDFGSPSKSKKIPDGQGGPSKKLIQAIQTVSIFQPKGLYSAQILDLGTRNLILSKMKKLFEGLGQLNSRYTSIEDFRQGLIADLVKPLKKKKLRTFLNPDNLIVIVPQGEQLLDIPGGGLRPLLQEYELAQVAVMNAKINRLKTLKNAFASQRFQPRITQQLSFTSGYNTQKLTKDSQTPGTSIVSAAGVTSANRRTGNGANTLEITTPAANNSNLVEPYRRFRYNFHYWLKNFKYNDDGTFQFMNQEGTPQTQLQAPPNIVKAQELRTPAVKLVEKKDANNMIHGIAIGGFQTNINEESPSKNSPTKLAQKQQQIQRYQNKLQNPPDEIPIPMLSGYDVKDLNNTKKNFFVLGPSGVREVEDPSQLQKNGNKQATVVVSQQVPPPTGSVYGKVNTNQSQSIMKGKPFDTQQILDSLAQIKNQQEEIKRRRFKPTSSPSRMDAHARNDRTSPTQSYKKPQEDLLKLRAGIDDDARDSLESSLNFRPIKGITKRKGMQITSEDESTTPSLQHGRVSQNESQKYSVLEMDQQQQTMGNISKLMQSPNIIVQGGQKSSFDSVFPINNNISSTQRNEIRFKHQQPHNSVLAGGAFNATDTPANRLNERMKALKKVTGPHTSLPNQLPNVEELLTQSNVFSQQMQFQSSFSQTAGVINQSFEKTPGKQTQKEQSQPITNLYQLMKSSGGQLNTILLHKQTQNNLNPISSNSGVIRQRPSNFKLNNGASSLKETANAIGAASLRSLKAAEQKTASSGMITQQMNLMPKTNSKASFAGLSKEMPSSGNIEDEVQSKPKTPLGQARLYQHISVSPNRFVGGFNTGANSIEFQQQLLQAQEDYMAQVAKQYPPGTVFFDKLKRKSAAIINFMNYMSGQQQYTQADMLKLQTTAQRQMVIPNVSQQSQSLEPRGGRGPTKPQQIRVGGRPSNPPHGLTHFSQTPAQMTGKALSFSVPQRSSEKQGVLAFLGNEANNRRTPSNNPMQLVYQ
ncbi:hypothetical protein FGO68_gene11572 [Halteria grandinella]|uniref:Uncharacterized protein n=1 Tax=Halteria grandinella TaxID=5974 RepID=A0A8J8T9H6_HALGN|nr:hypothetical protein FGO68_gene11572 [Halteria grandinella]